MHTISRYHILITRPEPQASKLSASFQKLGAKTTIFSTLIISPPPDMCEAIALIHKMNDYHRVIFTSMHAVSAALPHFPKKINTTLLAVGPSTQKLLLEAGYSCLCPEVAFNSEGILAMAECQPVKHKQFLLCAGIAGKKTLANELNRRGAIVHKAELYQRHSPAKPTLDQLEQWQQEINLVASTSQESLSNLVNLFHPIKQWLLSTPLLVISDNMLDLAKKKGFQTVLVANNATDEALIDALKNTQSL